MAMGIVDVIIGAIFLMMGLIWMKAVLFLYGSASGYQPRLKATRWHPVFCWLAHSLACAGDVNGDGYTR